MTESLRGKWIGLSPARKMVLEILHHGRRVPGLPLSKAMNVGPLALLRKPAGLTWTSIFLRAYALVAREYPELRRAYIPWPWPHLYEHPTSEAAVLLERDHQGESVVLGAKVRTPERQTLSAIDGHLRRLREAPVEQVSDYRQWLRVGRLPGFLRRFVFWQTLYLSGRKRAKRLGTFAISSLGSLGVEQHHPISPLTTYLTFGPISMVGDVTVKVIYDHRVMDGRTVARALVDLERVLNGEIIEELQNARRPGAAIRAASGSAAETLAPHS